jgi:hypothetical protein
MKQSHPMVYAALAIACLALALGIYAVVGERRDAHPDDSGACVDPQAREQIAALRRAVAERDALVGRLARAANASTPSSPVEPGQPEPEPEPLEQLEQPETSRQPERPVPARRVFTRFVTPSPAVTVTQKPDGTYDIRSTDPALAGSTMQVTAIGPSGEETQMLVRIPGP